MNEKEAVEFLKNNLKGEAVEEFFRTEKLSESFLEKYVGYFDEFYQFENTVLGEMPENWWIDFIENEADIKKLWSFISEYQKLSESFIEKYSKKLSWYSISAHQKLSESFIERHADEVDWYCISWKQTLSEDFIERHDDEVDWKISLKDMMMKWIGKIFQNIKNYQNHLLKDMMMKWIGKIFQNIKNYQRNLLKNI